MRTLFVDRARQALVTSTDLTGFAIRGLSAVRHLACSIEAKGAGVTFFVVGACRASVLEADGSTFAVGVFEAPLACNAGRITDLTGATVVVLSTTGLALGGFADLTGVALTVFGTARALVGETDVSTLTIFIGSAISGCTLVLEAKLPLPALFVREATCTCVVSTDLTCRTILRFQASDTGQIRCVAAGVVLAAAVVTATFDAYAVFTDLTVTAGSVVGTRLAAPGDTHLPTDAGFGVGTKSVSTL